MTILLVLLLTAASYLIGSVPFGLLISKAKGQDIRKLGSGNIGATNVLRCLGKPLGITCFVLDVLKGYLPAALFPMLGKTLCPNAVGPSIGILFGAAAILGHNFPVFLKFKGGKGVATSAGVLLGVAPLAVVIGLLTWVVVFKASGYVSLGSIMAALVVLLTGWTAGYEPVTAIALTLLGALTIYRHRTNIQRLMNGTENQFKTHVPFLNSFWRFSPQVIVIVMLAWSTLTVMPHDYYLVLRIAVCFSSLYLGYQALKTHQGFWVLVSGFMAIIYNPVIPIGLTKPLWLGVNMVTIITMATAVYFLRRPNKITNNE